MEVTRAQKQAENKLADYNRLCFQGIPWSGILVMAKSIFPDLPSEPHQTHSQVSRKGLQTEECVELNFIVNIFHLDIILRLMMQGIVIHVQKLSA